MLAYKGDKFVEVFNRFPPAYTSTANERTTQTGGCHVANIIAQRLKIQRK